VFVLDAGAQPAKRSIGAKGAMTSFEAGAPKGRLPLPARPVASPFFILRVH